MKIVKIVMISMDSPAALQVQIMMMVWMMLILKMLMWWCGRCANDCDADEVQDAEDKSNENGEDLDDDKVDDVVAEMIMARENWWLKNLMMSIQTKAMIITTFIVTIAIFIAVVDPDFYCAGRPIYDDRD